MMNGQLCDGAKRGITLNFMRKHLKSTSWTNVVYYRQAWTLEYASKEAPIEINVERSSSGNRSSK